MEVPERPRIKLPVLQTGIARLVCEQFAYTGETVNGPFTVSRAVGPVADTHITLGESQKTLYRFSCDISIDRTRRTTKWLTQR
jgi:hypothetical protein